LETLYLFFDNPPAPLDDIKPIHIRQFMDWRIKLTQDKLRKEGKSVAGHEGEVAANREKALISHVWNAARDSGLTDKANPCAGIKAYRARRVCVRPHVFGSLESSRSTAAGGDGFDLSVTRAANGSSWPE
jgi:hypothetical protein